MRAPILCALFLSLLTLMFASGCHKDEGPPPPLSLEQLPPALQKAFADAAPAVKAPLDAVLKALEAKDYSKAYFAMQTLSSLPGLSKQQARVTASGLITVNDALQQAQTQGDQKAAQTLKFYRQNK